MTEYAMRRFCYALGWALVLSMQALNTVHWAAGLSSVLVGVSLLYLNSK